MLTERVKMIQISIIKYQKASQALANIAKWVINIYKYNRIYIAASGSPYGVVEEATDSKAAADAALANAAAIV